jgi:hypothetical protein
LDIWRTSQKNSISQLINHLDDVRTCVLPRSLPSSISRYNIAQDTPSAVLSAFQQTSLTHACRLSRTFFWLLVRGASQRR